MSENTKSKIKFGESYIAYLGITLIFLSAFLLNKSSKFPGINALSVCVGTAMLIYGIEKKNILLHRLLVSKFFVLIGKVSYSLYLWHWPILAYMRYVYGSYKLPLSWLIIAFILTFILSIISYFFVENKARYLKLNLTSSFLSFYVAPTLATFLLIAILNKTDLATEENLSPLYTMCGGEEICHGKINDNCIRGDKSKKSKILIVGDSHTQHYNYFFEELGQKYGWSAKVVSSSSCSPVLDYNELLLPEWAHEGCKNLKNYFWNDYKNYEIIVLSSRWDFHLGLSDCQGHDPDFTKKLEATLHELSKNVKHVYVLSQIPLLPNNPFRIKKFLNLGLPINVNIHSSNFELANEKVKKLTEKYHNVTWVDTASLFKHFDNGVFFNKNPVYMDNTHLNQYGAKVLATLFSENIFRRHMPQPQD